MTKSSIDTVFIPWTKRLDELWDIAEATGADSHSCEEEWFINARTIYGQYTPLDLEDLPKKKYEEWKKWADLEG